MRVRDLNDVRESPVLKTRVDVGARAHVFRVVQDVLLRTDLVHVPMSRECFSSPHVTPRKQVDV